MTSSEEPQAKKAKIEDEGPSSLQSMKYSNEGGTTPKLAVLDQLLIPQEKAYIGITTAEEAFSVIQKMQIRGN
jgi:methylthioribose-1-phosphate isomerase